MALKTIINRFSDARCLHKVQVLSYSKEKTANPNGFTVCLVEMTGLEPAASASRTQRSTKLSHISIFNFKVFLNELLNYTDENIICQEFKTKFLI